MLFIKTTYLTIKTTYLTIKTTYLTIKTTYYRSSTGLRMRPERGSKILKTFKCFKNKQKEKTRSDDFLWITLYRKRKKLRF
jgi:hypothetical protein